MRVFVSRLASTTRKQIGTMHFIDIGANLTDDVFKGHYNGKPAHVPDLSTVLERAREHGVMRTMVTAGTLEQTHEAASLCRKNAGSGLYSTAGIHPTRASGVPPGEREAIFARLAEASLAPGVIAIGECGLDYDREQFSTREQQMPVFLSHFALAEATQLPMFFHNRNTGEDFARIVRENRTRFGRGVVHSFTGPIDELRALLALDLDIGINGCSLKTEENLAALREIPLERLHLETDAPYCGIRKSHASFQHVVTAFPAKDKKKYTSEALVKGRCEPCQIVQVCEVVAAVKGCSQEEVARAAYNNSMRVFFPTEAADMGESPYDLSLSTGARAS